MIAVELTITFQTSSFLHNIHHINLLIDPKDYLIGKVEVYNIMGGLTRFTLGKVTEQKKFKQDFFTFVPPDGVRVVEE